MALMGLKIKRLEIMSGVLAPNADHSSARVRGVTSVLVRGDGEEDMEEGGGGDIDDLTEGLHDDEESERLAIAMFGGKEVGWMHRNQLVDFFFNETKI